MKRLVAKVGEYQKDGEKKSEWVRIGVINQGSNGGEYALIDPTVNLAGVLAKQNMLAIQKRQQGDEKARTGTSVICSVFDENAQQPQQGGFQPSSQQSPHDDIPF
jgi:hypothetical protein